jgi:mannose-1-phosphate guanylyltransferase
MEHFYALILAGGTGSRLWPLSRPEYPKPLLALTDERSLFHMTVDRLEGLFAAERLFVVTRRGLDAQLLQDAPQLSADNFVCEPSSRDTAPAVGLGVMEIARRDPEAVIAIVSSDHHIGRDEPLLEALQRAYDLARVGYIVTLGVQPTRAATEFGYIQHGEAIDDYAYGCQNFTEKPDAATAQAFLEAGGYSWDAGILIASARSMIAVRASAARDDDAAAAHNPRTRLD